VSAKSDRRSFLSGAGSAGLLCAAGFLVGSFALGEFLFGDFQHVVQCVFKSSRSVLPFVVAVIIRRHSAV